MPTLYPPIDTMSEACGEVDILSPELKESFQVLNSIHREERCDECDGRLSAQLVGKRKRENTDHKIQNEEVCSKPSIFKPTKKDDLETRKCETALFAAVAAESEILKLKNGIEELETILMEQDNDGRNKNDNIISPTFPPVIVDCAEVLGKDQDIPP